jgi:hypothetical protein
MIKVMWHSLRVDVCYLDFVQESSPLPSDLTTLQAIFSIIETNESFKFPSEPNLFVCSNVSHELK